MNDEGQRDFLGTVTMKLGAYKFVKGEVPTKVSVTFCPLVGKKQSASKTMSVFRG